MSSSDERVDISVLQAIWATVGNPSDYDHPSEYIENLKSATEGKQQLLDQYLEWIDEWIDVFHVEELPHQLLEEWLESLLLADWSSITQLVDLRTALSFGEVDYLTLAYSTSSNEPYSYLIAANPGILGPSQFVGSPSGLSSIDRASIHPALIQLSVSNLESSETIKPPIFALPIGRLVKAFASPTAFVPMRLYVNELENMPDISSVPRDFSTFRNNFGPRHDLGVEEEMIFFGEVLDSLTIIGRETRRNAEEHRCTAWKSILRNKANFEDQNYAVVIDAVSPEHPLWLISIRNELDIDGEWQYNEQPRNFDAAQLSITIKDWSKGVDEIKIEDENDLVKNKMKGFFKVHPVDVKQFSEALRAAARS